MTSHPGVQSSLGQIQVQGIPSRVAEQFRTLLTGRTLPVSVSHPFWYTDIFNLKPSNNLVISPLLAANGFVAPGVLLVLQNEHVVKDSLALEFLVEVFVTFKQEKGMSPLIQALKKGGVEGRLLEFCPINKRTEEYFRSVFMEKGLSDIVKLHKAQASQEAKRELQVILTDAINDQKAIDEIVVEMRDFAEKTSIPEHEVVALVWSTIMSIVEWNKKEELLAEQALKHLQAYVPLFKAFTTTDRAELALILKVQEFCYENMNFMKVFSKIIVLFYKKDVLSEDPIFKWYKEAHSPKGKMHFLEQMKKFVDWLHEAEEEGSDDE